MDLDQSFFTEGNDTIDSQSLNIDSFVVSKNTNALGGDDSISIFTPQDQRVALDIQRGATLDGGLGRNVIRISGFMADEASNPGFGVVGLFIAGVIKRFVSVISSGGSGIQNAGTIDLSNGSTSSSVAISANQKVDIVGLAGRGYGLANNINARISLPSSEKRDVTLFGSSVLGLGFQNKGTISTNLGADFITGISRQSIGFNNDRTISLGSNNDTISATSITNQGSVNFGSGADKLRFITGRAYSVTSIIRGKGRIDLNTGNDQFIFGGAATGVDSLPLNSPPGKVSGGSGTDTIVITSGQFRFSRLGGSSYRIFDANNAIIADVDGFELVQSASGFQPVAIRDGLF